MKALLAIAMFLTLTACMGPGPGLTGNDTGGIIPYPLVASQSVASATSERVVAARIAEAHCARHNKRFVDLYIRRQYGEYVSFTCSWR
jgi:hypothetical protein